MFLQMQQSSLRLDLSESQIHFQNEFNQIQNLYCSDFTCNISIEYNKGCLKRNFKSLIKKPQILPKSLWFELIPN